MSKRPVPMTAKLIQDIIGSKKDYLGKDLFLNSEVGVLYGSSALFRQFLMQDTPFTISDYRIGIVERGEIHVMINLVERRLAAGTMAFMGPGTIIQPLGISDDLCVKGIVLFPSFRMPFADGRMPAAFNGQTPNFQIRAEEKDFSTALLLIETLWRLVQQGYHPATFSGLVMAVMNHWSLVYEKANAHQTAGHGNGHDIFERFILLVNTHAAQHHQINFYADRLCLTGRYLGTVVRQASGRTAKEWIDQALVTKAKVLLRHSDKSVLQISEELCFATPSFFSKYFKRLTGMMPTEYKAQ